MATGSWAIGNETTNPADGAIICDTGAILNPNTGSSTKGYYTLTLFLTNKTAGAVTFGFGRYTSGDILQVEFDFVVQAGRTEAFPITQSAPINDNQKLKIRVKGTVTGNVQAMLSYGCELTA